MRLPPIPNYLFPPEVEHAVRFQTFEWMQNLIKHDEKKFYEDRVMIAENDIFNVLSIPFLSGGKSPEHGFSLC